MIIKSTQRLLLRHINANDAKFLLKLYNQPAFLQQIGDRGVNTINNAKNFILRTQQNYKRYGFWLYLVEDKVSGEPIGVNGLIQRDYLEAPDIGFAIDEKHWRQGFAFESSQAVVEHAREIGQKELLAITSPDNENSIKLLTKLGFDFSKCDDLEGNGEEINLYHFNLLA
ncbi:GNAT family N-acetyltransferase [Kangiella sediminilitoris]|uniref:GCN5-related N-acetyltransferase n=1 Tax=Kangiella sediminilitoris TaxID=1144748 RepID=A0A1B3B7Z2_9GAMM|nr:GNAT family N-acetyltransferase [Kangiella sediminilitoris]AOE48909.1 GCN5-related N-acetyltransferase [Kangiella sediminilitoris]